MKLVTTKNNSIGSRIIRWATGEDESHFLFVFDDSLVFHSRFLGTGLGWWNTIKRKNEIVWSLEVPLPLETEEAFYRSFVDGYDGDGYDFLGAFYLGFRLILYRFLGVKMPSKNRLGRPNKHFCSELAFKPDWDLIKAGLKEKLENIRPDLVTPYKARSILENELLTIEER